MMFKNSKYLREKYATNFSILDNSFILNLGLTSFERMAISIMIALDGKNERITQSLVGTYLQVSKKTLIGIFKSLETKNFLKVQTDENKKSSNFYVFSQKPFLTEKQVQEHTTVRNEIEEFLKSKGYDSTILDRVIEIKPIEHSEAPTLPATQEPAQINTETPDTFLQKATKDTKLHELVKKRYPATSIDEFSTSVQEFEQYHHTIETEFSDYQEYKRRFVNWFAKKPKNKPATTNTNSDTPTTQTATKEQNDTVKRKGEFEYRLGVLRNPINKVQKDTPIAVFKSDVDTYYQHLKEGLKEGFISSDNKDFDIIHSTVQNDSYGIFKNYLLNKKGKPSTPTLPKVEAVSIDAVEFEEKYMNLNEYFEQVNSDTRLPAFTEKVKDMYQLLVFGLGKGYIDKRYSRYNTFEKVVQHNEFENFLKATIQDNEKKNH